MGEVARLKRSPAAMLDVAVIGGGIVGTAAAATLAAAGARVTLYETGPAVAAAASGRNAGEICHPPDPVLGRLYHESLDRYRALAGELVGPGATFRVPAAPIGVLDVAFDGDLVRRVAASLAAAQPDLCPEVVDGAALSGLEPLLADGLTAFRLETGYPIRPADATRAFAAFAQRHGAVIWASARAHPWIERGVTLGVEVSGRKVAAGYVIVAAGPWTPELVDPSDHWRPIRPVWGVIVEMDLVPAPRHVVGELRDEGSLLLAGPSRATNAPSVEANGDLPLPILGVNPGPLPAGGGVASTALGGTLAPVEPDAHRVAPTLVEHAHRFLPSIHAGQMGAVRACARPQSADGRPLIGFVAGIERLVVAAGNGAWGISTGPATARLDADAVLAGTDAGVPPELLARRFGGVGGS